MKSVVLYTKARREPRQVVWADSFSVTWVPPWPRDSWPCSLLAWPMKTWEKQETKVFKNNFIGLLVFEWHWVSSLLPSSVWQTLRPSKRPWVLQNEHPHICWSPGRKQVTTSMKPFQNICDYFKYTSTAISNAIKEIYTDLKRKYWMILKKSEIGVGIVA